MTEFQNLTNPNNYKILIQQKFNRRKKIKCKYLTPKFELTENVKDALTFSDFNEAEKYLSVFFSQNSSKPKLRIIVKYQFNEGETLAETT